MRWFQQFARSAAAPISTNGEAPLLPGERVLASAATPYGIVRVTERALLLPGEGGRRPWHTLASATWDDEAEALVLACMGEEPSIRLVLTEPGSVPEVVRERLTASIVVNRHVPLAGNAGVRILGRRRAGTDELLWQLRFDSGVNGSNPQIRHRAEASLAEVRAQLGV